ncbi:MAG: ABC transporter permease [Acidobacteriia bacterium]|nr:ABC transporter permease [Terriglobia bacterium]
MFSRRRRTETDFSEEVQAHLALEVDRLRAEGMSEANAEAEARRRFGNVLSTQERFHESSHWLWLEHLQRDVAFALRVLLRNPGFTFVAALSLALGIGVNALVFSVVNALVLRPLPVRQPEQLVFLEDSHGHPGNSFPNYKDLRDRNQVFSGLLGYRVVQVELDLQGGAARTWGYLATGNYFDELGVRPVLGRFFHQEDDLHPGASPYAVLSYGSWQSRFGGDRDIVGKTIRINRQPYTVLGVAPPEFHGTEVFYWPEVWVPMMMEPQIEVGNPWLDSRRSFNTWVIGRLKPGVAPDQALANINTIALDLARQFPEANEGLKYKFGRPGLVGDMLGGPARAFSLGIQILAMLVLLTACANLASLVTARSADRQREIAIRLSIGATRWRVARQMLTETIVLAALGGGAGYALAWFVSRTLSAWRAPLDFPVQFDVAPDWRVFVFAGIVSVLSGALFGLAPARHASRTDANAVLKGELPVWQRGKLALRDVLVVLQVALCFVLVSACLLSMRGLQKSLTIQLGFQPQGVAVTSFDLGLSGYTDEKGRNFQQHALEAVRQIPGVQAAAYSNSVPLSIDQSNNSIYPEDQPTLRASEAQSAFVYEVSPQFFSTMGMKIDGRDFNWHDDNSSPRVAVVNLAFGQKVLRTQNPVGQRFRRGPGGPLVEVVGVTENGKYQTLTEEDRPAFFVPTLQQYNPTTTLIVRSSLPETEMVGRMRQTLARLDPELPLFGAGSLSQMLGFAFFPMHAAVIALGSFGLLAIMLAITGIHGLVSYSVARREREIGIRVAVGAGPVQIVRLVLGRTLILLAAGSAIGLAMALAAGQLLANIVYGVSPRDPLVMAAVCATVILLGIVSCWAPMRRALTIDPMVALHHE